MLCGNLVTRLRKDCLEFSSVLLGVGMYQWLGGGDFNEITSYGEKEGGCIKSEYLMSAFLKVIDWCQLRDLGFEDRLQELKEILRGFSMNKRDIGELEQEKNDFLGGSHYKVVPPKIPLAIRYFKTLFITSSPSLKVIGNITECIP
ncbi:unnamed protein product [Citrullus colocynthis]|uniref:Uncharacterized protein n=1 Tax=Citrullus colocynthis TaxID=252529 RepID=A0ABP0XN57_9ROSI